MFHPFDGSLPDGGDCPSRVVSALKKDMDLDILPYQNLGSFVCTQHSTPALELIMSNFSKNQACVEEYGSISKYREQCISILSHLWNGGANESPVGVATTGSSEAIMLAGLAMKRAWEEKKPGAGRRPNVVVGSNVHLCVLKFTNYFGVEARVVPVNARSGFVVDPEEVMQRLDQNTVGVFLTLGSTFTGHYDPVQAVGQCLDDYERQTDHSIPIHVDAASGGFVAPFDTACAHMTWDFRVRQVHSINVSGHKFGFSSCAVGWLVWRDQSCVPTSLPMDSGYLRGKQTAFSLSFSRSSASVVIQYFNFQTLGNKGYRERMATLLSGARKLSSELNGSGYFRCISPGHETSLETTKYEKSMCQHHGGNASSLQTAQPPVSAGLPVVVFTLSDAFTARHPQVTLSDLSDRIFVKRFSIPHYTLSHWGTDGRDIDVLRIVVRQDVVPQLSIIYNLLTQEIHQMCEE